MFKLHSLSLSLSSQLTQSARVHSAHASSPPPSTLRRLNYQLFSQGFSFSLSRIPLSPQIHIRNHHKNDGNGCLCWAQARLLSTATAPTRLGEAEVRIRYVGDLDGADDEWLTSSSARLRQPRGWGGAARLAD